MAKVILLWDVKKRGSQATLFYRALRGYEYRIKGGRRHSPGILDRLPEECWRFVTRSSLLIEEEYAEEVERVFREFERILEWVKFRVAEVEEG
jgi:hypothetical protein